MNLNDIYEKAAAGKRISVEEGIELLTHGDLIRIGKIADEIRLRKHPEKQVSIVIDRNINYSNICNVYCTFCAFYRPPKGKRSEQEGYVLTHQQIAEKLDELMAAGGTQILIQGGVHPDLKIEFYEDMFSFIKSNYPSVWIHGLSAVEVSYIAKVSGLSLDETIKRLKVSGLDSMPGAGAEILHEEIRQRISPLKITIPEWIEVHETFHRNDMRTSATMMFGVEEEPYHLIGHLEELRQLQDRTAGFTAFIPWIFQESDGAPLRVKHHATAHEYLKLLAVSRIYLDNFDNVQISFVTMGSKIGQVALRFGANDFGSFMMEENVVRAAGAENLMALREMCRLIREAGFTPVQRTMDYRILREFTDDEIAQPSAYQGNTSQQNPKLRVLNSVI
ncbi:MAG: dehypoxanthine futalosine cyclase [Calditrichaeota bacterium]|nr:dehypoxanthine futalosine cyclase [Calditrichota bacterium]